MNVTLELDGPEQHVLLAALGRERDALVRSAAAGGVAREMADIMGPIEARITRRLLDAMYGEGIEPEWTEPELRLAYGDR